MRVRFQIGVFAAAAAALLLTSAAADAGESFLANRHQGGCVTCHNTEAPASGAYVENDVCLKCHGPIEKLQKKTEGSDGVNPHKSHLGEIDCTLCHEGHQPSQSYCLSCHTNFHMQM